MKRNTEVTSRKVAKTAGRILAAEYIYVEIWDKGGTGWRSVPRPDIRALAASALTQTQDHAERETLRKGRLPKGHKRVKRHKPVVRNGKVRK